MTLEVSEHYTAVMEFTGEHNNVRLSMSFRVVCEENYYGKNCTTFCEAHDDDVNGHYTCNEDGSIHCLENHYGEHCTTFCVAQEDDMNGYYTCNEDGSICCRENYYGENCTTFCEAQEDDMNGRIHYTCNEDGTIHCWEGFENPVSYCRDGKIVDLS